MVISNSVLVFGNIPNNLKKSDISSKTRKIYGLNYPIGKGIARGFFSKESGLELVKSMLKQALLTETGERLMLQDFGCGLKRHLFEPLDEQTFTEIRNSIVTTITKYVPGVSVVKLNVAPLDKYGLEGLQALIVSLTVRIKELDNSIFEVGVEIV